jgi:hypothetical protein
MTSKLNFLQAAGDVLGIVAGIPELSGIPVAGIANDQRNPLLVQGRNKPQVGQTSKTKKRQCSETTLAVMT